MDIHASKTQTHKIKQIKLSFLKFTVHLGYQWRIQYHSQEQKSKYVKILLPIGILLVILLGVVLVIRKKKKKKAAQEEDLDDEIS